MSEFDDIERTLCQLPQVHVFKIPVRKTAGEGFVFFREFVLKDPAAFHL
jgi:hypothetical protein